MTGIAILTSQQDAIASLIRIRSRALSAKDADAVADCHSPGLVCYSMAPPLVSTGDAADLEAFMADGSCLGGGFNNDHPMAHRRRTQGPATPSDQICRGRRGGLGTGTTQRCTTNLFRLMKSPLNWCPVGGNRPAQ
jgi:hypothetical protein